VENEGNKAYLQELFFRQVNIGSVKTKLKNGFLG